MSKRESIIQALKTRLEAIAPPTYQTALGTNVFIHKSTGADEANVPFANIKDVTRRSVQRGLQSSYDVRDNELDVVISLIAADGDTADTTARSMVQDVIQAIGTDETFGGLAIRTDINEDRLNVNQDDKKVAGAELDITIFYRTNYFEY